MSLDAMKQALEALEHEARTGNDDAYRVERDALRAAIEQAQEPMAWVYPEGLEALKSGRPWTAYGSSGEGRIPLYLNDAVAPKAEPRFGGSGAGFESLPASPNWQGLTDDEIALICGECAASTHQTDDLSYARAIEAKLKEKNHG